MYNNKIEILLNLFKYENNELKIILRKKEDEPFKGYWMLPSEMLSNKESVLECTERMIKDIGFDNVYMNTCDVYSSVDRVPDNRILGISVYGLINTLRINQEVEVKEGYEWFSIRSIPKTVYDNLEIIEETSNRLKQDLYNTDVLKVLFPSDFTMPELQRLFELVRGKKIDRRNFRKKLLKLDVIEDTNEKNVTMTGRPAELYRFKDKGNKVLFYEQ